MSPSGKGPSELAKALTLFYWIISLVVGHTFVGFAIGYGLARWLEIDDYEILIAVTTVIGFFLSFIPIVKKDLNQKK